MLTTLPLSKGKILLFWLIGSLSGIFVDLYFDTRLDTPIHDHATVFHSRTEWKHSVIIALDEKIPEYISRKQALPLFALASNRAIDYGAKFVFMDATIFQTSPNMRYAKCIDSSNKTVTWSSLSESFNPLTAINSDNINHFSIPPPSRSTELFTLFNFEAAVGIEPSNFYSDVQTYYRKDPIFLPLVRYMNLEENAVAVRIASKFDNFILEPAKNNSDVLCSDDNEKNCRRIRFSNFQPTYDLKSNFPIIPLSELIKCSSADIPPEIKNLLKDKAVIIQLTTLDEFTDLHQTPLSISLFGTNELTMGPQVIADSIETLLLNDHPLRPPQYLTYFYLVLTAIVSTLVASYLTIFYALLIVVIFFFGGFLISFIFPIYILWPFSAVTITSLVSSSLCLLTHFILGTKQASMVAKYLPSQIRSLLLSSDNNFINIQTNAVVLISDLEGYTLATSLLKKPELIFNLINEYFDKTTNIIQNEYHGWLENYVGDLVCFYWPENGDIEKQKKLALLASIAQYKLQQVFFSELANDKSLPIPTEVLNEISSIISAGIGITTGKISMGNLGPKNGIQKFSALGDPLNISSRIESLSRNFNAHILITKELVETAISLDLKVRRIANLTLKGNETGIDVFSLGTADDERFNEEIIKQWDIFYSELISGNTNAVAPKILQKDSDTLKLWYKHEILNKNTLSWELKHK